MSGMTYAQGRVMTALIVWEAFLEHRSVQEISHMFDTVGTYEMRQLTMDSYAPWVDGVYAELEKHLGEDDPHCKLGFDSFDWDFVPALLLDHVDWDPTAHLPDVQATAAKLIALRALKKRNVA